MPDPFWDKCSGFRDTLHLFQEIKTVFWDGHSLHFGLAVPGIDAALRLLKVSG